MRKFISVNPYTNVRYGAFSFVDDHTVERALRKGILALKHWASMSPDRRSRFWPDMSDLLLQKKETLAAMMVEEMGKPIQQARAEVEKCALLCRYAAEKGVHFLAAEERDGPHRWQQVFFRPLGLVLGIMPWNFPLWQVFRYAVPALTAGNVTILKHAENVPRCALTIEELFREAGFPEGVFQNLFLTYEQVARLIADDRVQGVTLTGSDRAGAIVARQAGQHLKKTVLELGGSDPFIVLPDADELESILHTAVMARMQNNGQSCIAAKRLFIPADRREEAFAILKQELDRLTVGDPMDPAVMIGPLARPDLADNVMAQAADAIEKGAGVIAGRHHREGNVVWPHALFPVPPESCPYREEVFGPVFSVFTYENFDGLIAVVNDTPFGLGCAIWGNPETAYRLAEHIKAGTIAVNAITASHPALPFGGVKRSGFGREIGKEGFREFTNVQTVYED